MTDREKLEAILEVTGAWLHECRQLGDDAEILLDKGYAVGAAELLVQARICRTHHDSVANIVTVP